MNRKFWTALSILLVAAFALSACAQPVAVQQQTVERTVVVTQEVIVEKVVTPTPGPNPEATIPDVEEGAEITFWTFYLSPTFDQYILDTIARFNEAYPGVTVNWEDRQATLQEEYRNSLAAGNAPDVVNLSTSWVTEFASKDQLLSMADNLPQEVIDQYYPGLFNQVNVGGTSYQVPWYQAIDIYLVNKDVLTKAGLTMEDMPTNYEELMAVCKTIKEQTDIPCGMRMRADNLLMDMAYQGGVQVMNEDGTAFTFDSPEAVEWLNYWAEMVKNDYTARDVLLADDRMGLERFTTGQMPFYVTGPQLIRVVRENNPGLYGFLDIAPQAIGESGGLPPVSMSLVVTKASQYPKAAAALATFFTNPQSQLEFSKIVSIYPSTAASYQDPFFTQTPVAIEELARPLAEGIISKQTNILPEIPQPADVNEIVRAAFESVVFGDADAQAALSEAVQKANALLQ
jgi:ABC-type glycerol-3-phosphate transport system substrate-binding protein